MTDISKEAVEQLVHYLDDWSNDRTVGVLADSADALLALRARVDELERERDHLADDLEQGSYLYGNHLAELESRAEAAEASLSAVRAENERLREAWSPDTLHELAKKASLNAAKNAGTAPELLYAPILWALQEAARDALSKQESGSGWRPIETAPKDTDVLLGWWERTPVPVWHAEAGWAGQSNSRTGGYSNAWDHGSATHWMPLPAPPVEPVKENARD